MKEIFIGIAGLAAFSAAVAGALTYFVPDKSGEYSSSYSIQKENLSHLVDKIYWANEKEFEKYKVQGKKMPESKSDAIIISVMNESVNRKKADTLISFLDEVAQCDHDYFCKISNVEIKHIELRFFRTKFTFA